MTENQADSYVVSGMVLGVPCYCETFALGDGLGSMSVKGPSRVDGGTYMTQVWLEQWSPGVCAGLGVGLRKASKAYSEEGSDE